MQLSIKLNKAKALQVDETYAPEGLSWVAGGVDWVPALKYAAEQAQQFNTVAAAELVNGPLLCNPDPQQVEGFLGTVNTPPTEFGHVSVLVENYNQLELSPQMLTFFEDAFTVVAGAAAGYTEDGIAVNVGGIA